MRRFNRVTFYNPTSSKKNLLVAEMKKVKEAKGKKVKEEAKKPKSHTSINEYLKAKIKGLLILIHRLPPHCLVV